MTKRFAAVDVGSNTIKVTIIDYLEGGLFQKVLYKDFPSCLGHNLVNDVIDPNALTECYNALKEIGIIIKEKKVGSYKCIATHALRVAGNKAEIKKLIKENTGFDIHVISREEEARLTLQAVLLDNKEGSFVCINSGGGSTELGFHLPDGDRFSIFDFGAVNLYTDFIKDTKDIDSAITRIKQIITREFNKKVNFSVDGIGQVFSLGGSIFTAGYIYKKDSSRNFDSLVNLNLSLEGLESIINELKSANEKERTKIPGMDPKRSNTILPGILIHYFLLQLLNKDKIVISTRSISDGIIFNMLGKKSSG